MFSQISRIPDLIGKFWGKRCGLYAGVYGNIRFGFYDIQNNQGLGRDYQPQPSSASADITLTSTLIILDIIKTSSNNCWLKDKLDTMNTFQQSTENGLQTVSSKIKQNLKITILHVPQKG